MTVWGTSHRFPVSSTAFSFQRASQSRSSSRSFIGSFSPRDTLTVIASLVKHVREAFTADRGSNRNHEEKRYLHLVNALQSGHSACLPGTLRGRLRNSRRVSICAAATTLTPDVMSLATHEHRTEPMASDTREQRAWHQSFMIVSLNEYKRRRM